MEENPVSNVNESNSTEISINDRILDMTEPELKELGVVSGLDNDLYHKALGLSCTNLKIMLSQFCLNHKHSYYG